jgi:hypothetical protein
MFELNVAGPVNPPGVVQSEYWARLSLVTIWAFSLPNALIALAMGVERAEQRPEPVRLLGWL